MKMVVCTDKVRDMETIAENGGTHIMMRVKRGRIWWMPVTVVEENGRVVARSAKGTVELNASKALFGHLVDKNLVVDIQTGVRFVSIYEQELT